MHIFLVGLIIGILMAAPIGPIGILCIKKSLTDRLTVGIAVGLGAATADSMYAATAAFGLHLISDFFIKHINFLRIFGSIILGYLGITSLRQSSLTSSPSTLKTSVFKTYSSTLLLTLTNPLTIFAFMALFTLLGIVDQKLDTISALLLIFGVFFGSASWFAFLSSTTTYFKAKCTPTSLRLINKISGVLLVSFALYALVSIYRPGPLSKKLTENYPKTSQI